MTLPTDWTRRAFLRHTLLAPLVTALPVAAAETPQRDVIESLKTGYRARLRKILASGQLPYIDIESSCNPNKLDIAAVVRQMDEFGMGPMALSADPTKGQFARGVRYDDLSERLLKAYPDYFIPVGNGGQPPFISEDPDAFLAAQEEAARRTPMRLLGEYELRHYPSPRQFKRGETDRDVNIRIDGPFGHQLFALSQRLGIPFQIHFEIEDTLLAPLEAMLEQYPGARLIWCHLGQIRYIERATRYSPEYVEGLIRRFPNLYFDTAFGDARSTYPVSNQRHARLWGDSNDIREDWKALIVRYPERFLSALDLGGDRMDRMAEYDRNHRHFLSTLPLETRHQVAYGSAWKLLFNENFS